MTKEELAAKLNGREYPFEMNVGEITEAKKAGLVILYGASDDLLEFAGAIYDELGAYDGTTVHVTPSGKIIESLESRCDSDDRKRCDFYAAWLKEQKTFSVTADWCPAEPECSWLITATVPGAAFDIMEDGELYCRGLVIDMNEVNATINAKE